MNFSPQIFHRSIEEERKPGSLFQGYTVFMTEKDGPEVITPEVLPPEDSQDSKDSGLNRGRAILAGFIIDVVDFVLRGPIGLRLGFPVGCIVGVILGRFVGLPWRKSLVLGMASGLYCAFPGTFLIPLGTLVGLLSGSSRFGKRR